MTLNQATTPSASYPQVFSRIQSRAYTRAAWDDAWIYRPYLHAQKCESVSSPGVGTASLVYEFGNILRAETTTFSQYHPLEIGGHFVKIALVAPNGAERDVWHGVIGDESRRVHGKEASAAIAGGTQSFRADGLEAVLDWQPIIGAYTLGFSPGEGEPYAEIAIGFCPVFNDNRTLGLSGLGNRSGTRGPSGAYLFSRDGETWSNLDIIEYLLTFYQPDGMTLVLGGQYEALGHIEQKHQPHATLRAWLNHLIDRRRGFGWRLIPLSNNSLEIRVFSVFDEPVTGDGIIIPANTNTTNVQFDSVRQMQNAIVKRAETTRVDAVVVEGARLKSCFTLYANDLEPGWSGEDEDAYWFVSETSEPGESDVERKTEKYEKVYQYYRVPRDWNWYNLAGAGENCAPGFRPDGTVDVLRNVGGVPMLPRPLLRSLPIRKQGGDAGEYMEPLVIYREPDGGPWRQHDYENLEEEIAAMRVRLSDVEMGFYLVPRINHELALSVAEEFPDSDIVPRIDYGTLQATVAVETDERLRVSVVSPVYESLAHPRILSLQVPELECWYVAPNTIVGITDGEVTTDAGGVVRNDRRAANMIAHLAYGWHSKRRAAISLDLDGIQDVVEIGQMVRSAYSGASIMEINTVVTSIAFDFSTPSGGTQILTGFWEIDASIVLDMPGMSSLKDAAREIRRIRSDVDGLREHVRALPLGMRPSGGVGSGASSDVLQMVDHSHQGDGAFLP